ncbi:hypothetical protein V7S43_013058 [Phytophthora oleae]|uniref:Leucine-rich repeat-containing N-terminal plant-type domain-containing protein n=1 Tax=Phytophthora oleae TaxID=2107226 RepID=A0ABD3F710_9STRA
MPYMLHFDFETLDFPDEMLYGDTSFPNLVLENRAFFFMSWDNAGIRGVPHVSLFFSLLAIGSMLNSEPPKLTESHSRPKIRSSKKKSIVVVNAIEVLTQASDGIYWVAKLSQQVYQTMVPLFFLATGGIVLALHLTAQHKIVQDNEVMSRMCLQRMHPWLAPNSSCAVVQYNCYQEGVVSPPRDVFRWLEREVVRKITFMHCSEFQMPPIILEFPSLMGIELWNVTFARWGEEAAVSARLHPNLLFLFFSFVNMTEIPDGILSPELPELLTDLKFAHTNVTSLPEAIVKSWKRIEVLYVEHSNLEAFVMQLPALSELSLIDNKFNVIPDEAFSTAVSTNYYNLALSHNAISHLPSKVNFCVFNLALEFTQLAQLPGWVKENVSVSLSLRHSSVCEPSANVQLPAVAHCGENDPLGEERFPTKIVEPFRALNA